MAMTSNEPDTDTIMTEPEVINEYTPEANQIAASVQEPEPIGVSPKKRERIIIMVEATETTQANQHNCQIVKHEPTRFKEL